MIAMSCSRQGQARGIIAYDIDCRPLQNTFKNLVSLSSRLQFLAAFVVSVIEFGWSGFSLCLSFFVTISTAFQHNTPWTLKPNHILKLNDKIQKRINNASHEDKYLACCNILSTSLVSYLTLRPDIRIHSDI